MTLLETLRNDIITATKAGNNEQTQILNMVLATIKNIQIGSEKELTDSDVEKILRKEVKKIEDSISQYEKMGRDDLVKKEKADFEIVNGYLPELMDEGKVREIVSDKIEQLGIKDMREMGKLMGIVMKELEGKADGNTVKNIVQELLSNNG
jgi:uncharacterized protein YqeY